MAQISLTFPDGNSRSYDAGVTAAEVAASIAPRWPRRRSRPRSTARIGICNGRSSATRDPHPHHAGRRPGAGTDPPRPGPHHGPRRAGDLARREGHHRPGHQGRLVLRFRPRRSLHARGSGRHREEDARDHQRPRPGPTEVWDRARAIAHYEQSGEPFKVELVEAIPGDQPIRMYWHGPWQDLCRGPHLQHTGQVPADAFKLMNVAGAYWRGDSATSSCSASTASPSGTATT
jgi:threonyl-tRNA synthetase